MTPSRSSASWGMACVCALSSGGVGGFASLENVRNSGILLQAATVGYLVTERPAAGYQTASGGQTAVQPGTYALVRFADNATAAAIATTLANLDMNIVEGPRQGALFRIRIGAAGLSEKDRDGRIDALRRRPGLVVLVTPAP